MFRLIEPTSGLIQNSTGTSSECTLLDNPIMCALTECSITINLGVTSPLCSINK